MKRLFSPRFLSLAAAALLGLQSPCAWARYDVPELEKVEQRVLAVTEKTTPAVVALLSPAAKGSPAHSGSGVIVSEDGLIVTAAHVVDGQTTVKVLFHNGKQVQAKVLGADRERDVALARITDPGTYPHAELGDTADLAVGTLVVALGHPGGFDPRRRAPVRFGRVFAIDHEHFITSDCVLVSGDSGGPLFDLEARVIGIHSRVSNEMYQNFDAPMEAVRQGWDRMLKGEWWGSARPSALSKMSPEELGGLDADKFQKRVMAEAVKNKGRVSPTPAKIADWLKECGMQEEKLKALDAPGMVDLMQKAMNIAGEAMKAPTMSEEELGGLNLERFRKHFVEEAMKNQGRMKLESADIAKLLREYGMSEEKVKSLSVQELGAFVAKVMGVRSGGAEKAIVDQDKEVLEAVKPTLDPLGKSVVALLAGGKALTLGTIVRADGFVLTKRSEIAKAKGSLTVRLADGREFPGVEVRQFADHDLALVKIDADALPAVTIPETSEPLALGRLIFTPGGAAGPMLAMGVVGVQDRALKDSGGYLGLGLEDDGGEKGVVVREVVVGGPAARAHLIKKDRIVAVNDNPVAKAEELTALIRSLAPNDKVQLQYFRGDEERTAEVTLGDRAKLPTREGMRNPATAIGTKVSDRVAGFPMIFQHDQPLKPEECGSVVADLHGRIVGVNIARAGRVNTFAIPAGTVAGLLKTVDFAELAKQGGEALAKLPKGS